MLDQMDGPTFEHHFDRHGQAREYFKTQVCGSDFLSFIAFNRFKFFFLFFFNTERRTLGRVECTIKVVF